MNKRIIVALGLFFGVLLSGVEYPLTSEFISFDGQQVAIPWSLSPQQAQRQGFRRLGKHYDKPDYYALTAGDRGEIHFFFSKKNNALAFCIINDNKKNNGHNAKKRFLAVLESNMKLYDTSLVILPEVTTRVSKVIYFAIVRPGKVTLIFSFGGVGSYIISQIRVYNPAFFPADEDFVKNHYRKM